MGTFYRSLHSLFLPKGKKGRAQVTDLLARHTTSLKRWVLKGEEIMDAENFFFKRSYVQLPE